MTRIRCRAREGAIIDMLGVQLVHAVDLERQAKQAHWNVKGPTFVGPPRAVRSHRLTGSRAWERHRRAGRRARRRGERNGARGRASVEPPGVSPTLAAMLPWFVMACAPDKVQ